MRCSFRHRIKLRVISKPNDMVKEIVSAGFLCDPRISPRNICNIHVTHTSTAFSHIFHVARSMHSSAVCVAIVVSAAIVLSHRFGLHTAPKQKRFFLSFFYLVLDRVLAVLFYNFEKKRTWK